MKNIELMKSKKKERYEREFKDVWNSFKEFSEYDYRIRDKKQQIESLISKHIEDENFEKEFYSKIEELKKNIESLKTQIKENKEEENYINKSKILSDNLNKSPSNNAKILHRYYKLCNIIEKMRKNDNTNLSDNFNIIVSNDLERDAKDLDSFPECNKKEGTARKTLAIPAF